MKSNIVNKMTESNPMRISINDLNKIEEKWLSDV